MNHVAWIVGAFGTGKTHLYKQILKWFYKNNMNFAIGLPEGDVLLEFLKNKDTQIQANMGISYYYLSLRQAIEHDEKTLVIADAHPFLCVVYQETFDELGMFDVSDSDVLEVREYYKKVSNYANSTYLKDITQSIIFMNPSFEQNRSYVKDRYSKRINGFSEEIKPHYLKTLRKNLAVSLQELELPVHTIVNPEEINLTQECKRLIDYTF